MKHRLTPLQKSNTLIGTAVDANLPVPPSDGWRHLWCSLVEDVDEAGRSGVIVYVPSRGPVSEVLYKCVETLVTELLQQHAVPFTLATVAVEDRSEMPATEELIRLIDLPACLKNQTAVKNEQE